MNTARARRHPTGPRFCSTGRGGEERGGGGGLKSARPSGSWPCSSRPSLPRPSGLSFHYRPDPPRAIPRALRPD